MGFRAMAHCISEFLAVRIFAILHAVLNALLHTEKNVIPVRTETNKQTLSNNVI
jgi:hypothetical protein